MFEGGYIYYFIDQLSLFKIIPCLYPRLGSTDAFTSLRVTLLNKMNVLYKGRFQLVYEESLLRMTVESLRWHVACSGTPDQHTPRTSLIVWYPFPVATVLSPSSVKASPWSHTRPYLHKILINSMVGWWLGWSCARMVLACNSVLENNKAVLRSINLDCARDCAGIFTS